MKRRDFVQSSLILTAGAFSGFRPLRAAARGSTHDVDAVTGDGRQIKLRGKDLEDLSAQLRGNVLLAGDNGYDAARLILNPSFDKRPAVIVQPTNVTDVQTAVKFARANELLVAVKCGGHSHSGQSTCDRGMQIDLSKLRSVKVDAAARRAFVAGGTLLGQVDLETSKHGLVTPLGTVSHTGVGGLTLGGGFGRIARRFGMSIDNLASVEIVTADGQIVRASAEDNPDLFWGVRGGGGNFGIVTNFEFVLHPMQREVVAGTVVFPIARARDALSMWADYAGRAPDELYLDPILALPPGGAAGNVILEVCYSGVERDAERALSPLRKLGTPAVDSIKKIDYVQAQRANDSTDSRAVASYIKSGFVAQLPPKFISAMIEGLQGDPRRSTMVFMQHCGGACSRVPDSATAFAHRYALANLLVMSGWPYGQDPTPHIAATRRHWSALEPFTRGFYVNDMPQEATKADISENYRGNFAKLAALKTQYDPKNLFRLNANVQPKKA